MSQFLFTANSIINLYNVCVVEPSKEHPNTKTILLFPGIQNTLDMPYEEFKALVAKWVKDQYEFSDARSDFYNKKRTIEMGEMLERIVGHK
jgi:hypothetical protein